MTLTSKPLALIVVGVFFSAIAAASALGWWQTESSKQAASFTSGAFAGQADPADIRGSYTLGDVERNFAIPAAILAQAFNVTSADPAAFAVKSLEEQYAAASQEIGTASLRLFVALYLGLPYDLSSGDYLPQSAVALLADRPLAEAERAYVAAHTLDAAALPAAPEVSATLAAPATPGPDLAPTVTHVPSSDAAIRGKTTFAELGALGLNNETIVAIIGGPIPAPGMTVKDYCSANGLSFETVKAALEAALP